MDPVVGVLGDPAVDAFALCFGVAFEVCGKRANGPVGSFDRLCVVGAERVATLTPERVCDLQFVLVDGRQQAVQFGHDLCLALGQLPLALPVVSGLDEPDLHF